MYREEDIKSPLSSIPYLLKLSNFIDKHSVGNKSFRKWGRRIYRCCLNQRWKHRYDCGPRFDIRPCKDGSLAIRWDGWEVKRLQPLTSLQNHDSGPAYIVASGPSLNDVDLSFLRHKVTFAVNGTIAKFQEAGFSPSFSVIVDRDFFKHRREMVVQALRGQSVCLYSSVGMSILVEESPEDLINGNVFLLDRVFQQYLEPAPPKQRRAEWINQQQWIVSEKNLGYRVGWSKDIARGVFGGGTVVYAALQAACYMGYSPVYLLGVDLGGGRAYDEGSAPRPSFLDRDFNAVILPNFALLKRNCQTSEFKVFNLSQNSRLWGKLKISDTNVKNPI